MTPENATRFGQSFGMLCEVFDRKTTPLITKAYFQALRDFPIEQVEAAIGQAISSGKWFPKPVELRELITGPKASQAEQIESAAMQQVNEIMGQIRAVGYYGTPTFSDPVTADLMSRRFNFRALCSMTEKELKFWSKDFVDAYQSGQKLADKGLIAIEGGRSLKQLSMGIGRGV